MNTMLLTILRYAALIPAVVARIEQMHPGAPGTTKKQLAHDSLDLAAAVAAAVEPQFTPAIGPLHDAVGDMIDSTVAAFNKAGAFTKSPLAATAGQ